MDGRARRAKCDRGAPAHTAHRAPTPACTRLPGEVSSWGEERRLCRARGPAPDRDGRPRATSQAGSGRARLTGPRPRMHAPSRRGLLLERREVFRSSRPFRISISATRRHGPANRHSSVPEIPLEEIRNGSTRSSVGAVGGGRRAVSCASDPTRRLGAQVTDRPTVHRQATRSPEPALEFRSGFSRQRPQCIPTEHIVINNNQSGDFKLTPVALVAI
jgi:hypothetical protein